MLKNSKSPSEKVPETAVLYSISPIGETSPIAPVDQSSCFHELTDGTSIATKKVDSPQAYSRDKEFERDGYKELGCSADNRMANSASLSQI